MNAADTAFLACLEGRCGPCASCRATRALLAHLEAARNHDQGDVPAAERNPPLDTEVETVAAAPRPISGQRPKHLG